jgi:hypothetical protein
MIFVQIWNGAFSILPNNGSLGVDVMITIFCDSGHFSAKIFSKTNVMSKLLQKLEVVWAKKRQYF